MASIVISLSSSKVCSDIIPYNEQATALFNIDIIQKYLFQDGGVS